MTEREVKEILEKQLKLLSEYSEKYIDNCDLADVSNAMLHISQLLLSP